jgi:aspartate/methionine/tyrosine aminotransferase
MKFSNRTSFADNDPSPFSRLLALKKKERVPFWDLTESNPTLCGFSSIGVGILEPLQDARNLVYTPDPQGLLESREAVSAYYAEKNIQVSPDRIFLTSGTSEAYNFLFHLLCDPGDEVLCVSPGYPLFEHLALMADVGLCRLRAAYDRGWTLEMRQIEEKRTPKTKALILVNPNNPTGHYAQFLEGSLPLISDEVFLDFNLQDRRPKSAASLTEMLTFTLSGASKILGLPQMKLSWIVVNGPEKLCRETCRRLEVIADAYLSVNTPSQRALGTWLGRKTVFVTEVVERLRSNLGTLNRELLEGNAARPAATLRKTEGGWYATLRLHPGHTDEETASYLLQEKNVLVHPGYFFDFEEESLVLSLLPEKEKFREGVRRMAEGLRERKIYN